MPVLFLVMAIATIAGTAGICGALAAGGWAMLAFALLSVLIGAVVVLLAIGRALNDEDR